MTRLDQLLEAIENAALFVRDHALMIICSTAIGLVFAAWLADIRL